MSENRLAAFAVLLLTVSPPVLAQNNASNNEAGATLEPQVHPVDPDASSATVALLNRIRRTCNAKEFGVWAGQNIGHTNDKIDAYYWKNVQRLTEATGMRPGLLGFDYGFDRIGKGYPHANRYLIRHWNQGGLVTISMHPRNPWRWSEAHDTRLGDIDVLLRPGTAVNHRWRGILNRVSDGLEELQEAGVVVLWRPLHEMNGHWFWWSGEHYGHRMTPFDYQRLWRSMYDHLTNKRQLHNLLWVYSPSAVYESAQRPVTDYYPGDEYVDIVGIDFYGPPESDSLRNGLEDLAKLNKPVAITEFSFSVNGESREDNRRMVQVLRSLPVRPAFVLYWHSWKNRPIAIIDHSNPESLLEIQPGEK